MQKSLDFGTESPKYLKNMNCYRCKEDTKGKIRISLGTNRISRQCKPKTRDLKSICWTLQMHWNYSSFGQVWRIERHYT